MVDVAEDRVQEVLIAAGGGERAQRLRGQGQAGSVLGQLGQQRCVIGGRQGVELVDQQCHVPTMGRRQSGLAADGQREYSVRVAFNTSCSSSVRWSQRRSAFGSARTGPAWRRAAGGGGAPVKQASASGRGFASRASAASRHILPIDGRARVRARSMVAPRV